MSVENCSIGRSLRVLGEKWTLLILREAFNGVRRFEDLQGHLRISRPLLSQRLQTLVAVGLLEKVPYQAPNTRPRHEYRLTQKGRDLFPVLVALQAWGDRYLADPEGPAVELTHRDCGGALGVQLVDEHGHVVDSLADVTRRPGPGARPLAS